MFKATCGTISHVQEYECQVVRDNIPFDACLFQELKYLKEQGVVTLGCCCGMHVDSLPNSAYIQVHENCIPIMLKLGYEKRTNSFGAVFFVPKTEIVEEE